MKNVYSEGGRMQLESSAIAGMPSYIYLERLMNMENDLDDELNRRSRAAGRLRACKRGNGPPDKFGASCPSV